MQVKREDLTVVVFTTVVRKETKDRAISDLYQLGGDGKTFCDLGCDERAMTDQEWEEVKVQAGLQQS